MDRLLIWTLIYSLSSLGLAQRLPTPFGITVSERTTSRVRVNWRQPLTVKFARFIVKISPRATIVTPDNPSDTTRTFDNLQPGIPYTVTLRGETSDRRRSRTLRFRIYSEPHKPTALVLTAIREVELSIQLGEFQDTYAAPVVGLHVDWEPPEGRTGLAGYDVRIRPKEDCAMLYPQPNVGEEPDRTSRIFAGLTPGQEYTVTVRTKAGPPHDLVYSSPITATRRLPPATPYHVEVTDEGSTHATVNTMGPLNGIHDDLEFVFEPDHGIVGQPSLDPIYNHFHVYTITGLQPDTTYKVKVYALSQGVRSYEPYTVTIRTKPTTPLVLRVTGFGQDFVTLQWDQPIISTSNEQIEYLITYEDIEGIRGTQTETVRATSGDFLVNARIQQLIPGVTYRFRVYTRSNGEEPELQSEVIQTTIPPRPIVAMLDVSNGGLIVVFDKPPVGECPRLKVTVSPNAENKPPTYHMTGDEIYLPNIPREERYTIRSRCVSNNVEGPERTVSSRAVVDPETGKVGDPPNLPRRTLPCIPPRNPNPRRRPDIITPDACCGNRPYNQANQQCCFETLLRQGDTRLCCHMTPYSAAQKICCAGGILLSIDQSCNNL